MKPNEILGMVEEAAGTRMYETKRVAALSTIDKKQLKLDQINAVLSEEITPTLEKLRGEKQNYLKWSKNHADIERLERFVVAGEYHKSIMALDAEGYSEMEEQLAKLQSHVDKVQSDIAVKDKELEDRAANSDAKKELQLAKKKEDEHSKELVKETSIWESAKENVDSAQSDLEAAQANLEECVAAVEAKQSEIESDTSNTQQMLIDAQEAEKRCAQLATDYQNMCAGISSSQGGEGRTLPEQISSAHADSKSAAAKIEQATMKIKHLTKELKSVESELKKQGKSATDLAKKKDKASAKVAELQQEVGRLDFSSDEFSSLEKEKSDLESSMVEMTERIETLQVQLGARLSFEYKDPVRGFDRSKVKGIVAKLVQVKDTSHATALEVTAGGKLFQVVVDDHITSKALIERGQLQRRVTIIPLDKVQQNSVSQPAIDRANAIAKNHNATVHRAIDLIEFDEEVRNAMEYSFGSTIIVDNSKAADEICSATNTRAVTLQGDVYEPGGTISGGSAGNMGLILSNIAELATKTKELESVSSRLSIVASKVESMIATASKFDKVNAKLELASAELEAVEKQLSHTSFGMLTERRDTMVEELSAAQSEVTEMKKEKDVKWKLYKHLKAQEASLTQQREERLKGMEQTIKLAKAEAAKKSKLAREVCYHMSTCCRAKSIGLCGYLTSFNFLQIGSQAQRLTLELEALQADVVVAEEAVEAAKHALDSTIEKEEAIQMKLGRVRATYDEVKEKLTVMESKWAECQAELAGLKEERAELLREANEAKLEAKKLSLQLTRMQKDRTEAEQKIVGFEKTYQWIASEKNAFGVPGGDYDFGATNPDGVLKDLNAMKKEQDTLVCLVIVKIICARSELVAH